MSKIVDVLNADREKKGIHRFGRDYYAKQASLPSGKRKKDEDLGIWAFASSVDDDYNNYSPFWTANSNEFDAKLIRDCDQGNSFDSRSSDNDEVLRISVNTEGLLHYPEEDKNEIQDLIVLENVNDEIRTVKINTENLLHMPEDEDEVGISSDPPKIEERRKDLKISVNTEGLLYDPKGNENNTLREGNFEKKVPIAAPRVRTFVQENQEPKVALPRSKNKLIKQYSISESNLNNENHPENISKTDQEQNQKHVLRVAVNTEGLLHFPDDHEEMNEAKNTEIIVPKTTSASPSRINRTMSQLSIDENTENKPVIVSKRSDNTLIKKIYSDPVVRSFALTNREQIPVKLDDSIKPPVKIPSSPKQEEPEELQPVQNLVLKNNYSFDKNYEINVDKDHVSESSENISIPEDSDTEPMSEQYRRLTSNYKENDLDELKGKHLVASRLGEFSKSFPNLSRLTFSNENPPGNRSYQIKSDNHQSSGLSMHKKEKREIFVSVKNLMKLFENN